MEKRFVYADNAATTKISPKVLDAMMPYLTEHFGNASSVHHLGRKAKTAVETAREQAAGAFGCKPEEIYFTSGGTEADNWALTGICHLLRKTGKDHIVTTAIEHHAILNTCLMLENQGFNVTYVPVNTNGIVDAYDVKNALTSRTAIVSVMYANNEIGTIQPVSEIASMCREKNILFHTDAVQAAGHVKINVRDQNIDMMSVSGHKIHAPKGVGALYIRKGIEIPNLIYGGSQESGKRAGTENTAAIVGLGAAAEEAANNISERNEKTAVIRDRLISGLLNISGTKLNGDKNMRLSGNCNISFNGIDGESLILMLDMNGICVSGSSACTSSSSAPSHVLLALGLSINDALSSVRFSIDEETTAEDVDYIVKTCENTIKKLRRT